MIVNLNKLNLNVKMSMTKKIIKTVIKYVNVPLHLINLPKHIFLNCRINTFLFMKRLFIIR